MRKDWLYHARVSTEGPQRKLAASPQRVAAAAIGATAPWDQWDASPPTLEIMETKCIWSHLTFATIFFVNFRWALREAKFKGETERKEGGEAMYTAKE